jgi:hypothetical protein
MIDVVRSISSAAAIQTPTIIDCTDSQHLSMRSPIRFSVRDFFAGVFSYLSTRPERLRSEAALSMNRRFFYSQAWGES